MIEAALFVALLLVGVALVASAAGAHILHQFAVYECLQMRKQLVLLTEEVVQLRTKMREAAKEQVVAAMCPETAPERHPADVMGYDAYRKQQIEAAHRKYMERTSRLLPCDLKLVKPDAIRRHIGDRRY